MIGTLSLALFGLGANAALGALLVWTAYSGLERSPAHAVAVTLFIGSGAIGANWYVGNLVVFTTWTQLEIVTIAAAAGAVLGIGAGILAWEPDTGPVAPPLDTEREELDAMMKNRHNPNAHSGQGGD